MPKNKDLKRVVRARMRKTGESYTGARAVLLKKKAPPQPSVARADFAGIAGMSDDAVRAKTGRTWGQWARALDGAGAWDLPHREIAKHLREEHGLTAWWSQTVTVGYERIRGLREKGQRRGGGYEVSKSKTLPVPVSRLYRAITTKRMRDRWLPGANPAVRAATPGKSVRLTWEDGSPIEVSLTAKGEEKSQVTVQHGKLPTKAHAAKIREYWAERLGALAELLGSPAGRR